MLSWMRWRHLSFAFVGCAVVFLVAYLVVAAWLVVTLVNWANAHWHLGLAGATWWAAVVLAWCLLGALLNLGRGKVKK